MYWYEEEVRQLENRLKTAAPPGPRVVFYGSSSVRLWDSLSPDFPAIQPLNLGFGGSTLAACAWFFERLVVPTRPDALLLYAGDNDLGDERHPEEVYLLFCAMLTLVRQHFPAIPFTYLSIKPSPARWHLVDRIRFTNQIIAGKIATAPGCHYVDVFTRMLNAHGYPQADLFNADGLHLSRKGYRAWQQVLSDHREPIFGL
ncbi:MAG: GDSL family lipase [Ferruginibacter sp.]|nr:GDSL family lipase [Cytophagales bacterium]